MQEFERRFSRRGLLSSSGLKAIEVITQRCDRRIEGGKRAMGPRLHDGALHRGQDKDGQLAGIDTAWKLMTGGIEAGADVLNPAGEIHREQLAHGWIGLVQLQGQRSDRATIGTAAALERATVHGKQRK